MENPPTPLPVGETSVAVLFEETFEATGYDAVGWSESVGVDAVVDEDYSTINVGSPPGWESQCLRIVRPAAGVNALTTIDTNIDAAIAYWRFEVELISENLANGGIIEIARIQSSDNADAFYLRIYQKWDGLRHIQCVAYNVNAGTQYIYGPSISNNTKQVVEVKWDFTNKVFVYRIDGTDVYTSTIDAGGAQNTAKVRLGTPDYAASTLSYDMVWDNIAADDVSFLGEHQDIATFSEAAGGEVAPAGSLSTTYIEMIHWANSGVVSPAGTLSPFKIFAPAGLSIGGNLKYIQGVLETEFTPGGANPPTPNDAAYDPTTEATATYEVYLYSNTATLSAFVLGVGRLGMMGFFDEPVYNRPIAYLDKWTYLSFTQKLNDPDYHQLRFDLSPDDPLVKVLRDDIDVDTIIEIWRYDPITASKSMVYSGFNRTVVDQARAGGTFIFNMYGSGFTDLLRRRLVIPPAGFEHDEYTGPAESVAKSFINSQMAAPSSTARAVTNLVIEPDQGTGDIITIKARYTNLLTVIKNCAELGNIDFGIVPGSFVSSFEFQARPLWGLDRRVGNSAGNTPTIFSMELGNMSIPINSENTSEEITALYVGGAGQGIERVIVEARNTARINASPWNLREAFYDARDTTNTAALQADGVLELSRRAAEDTLTFNILNTPGSRWLTHWALGDLVTAFYAGKRFDKQIIEVSVIVTGQGSSSREVISAELDVVI
ncbi:MAG TPA: hypothetical protein PKD55_00185 [Bellilinea sp.]|nr:hypothetical protein [Bellilinea sp.]